MHDLRHAYGSGRRRVESVKGVSFEVEPGEFFTLLGPSGCGKTTTLQCIAGLERPASGRIEIKGTVVASQGRYVPTYRRSIGMVFQDYAVWPHMTVFDNVAFPLRAVGRKYRKGQQMRRRVMDVLAMMGMEELAARRPAEISGGQQQRVALARALVAEPEVLLLDEPLSNLDAGLRQRMRAELRQVQRRLGITTIFVTHDQAEALSMSNRVAVMSGGEVVQEGTPREIYRAPRTPFVAGFVGSSTLLAGRITSVPGGDEAGRYVVVDTKIGRLRCRISVPDSAVVGRAVVVVVRPESVMVGPGSAERKDQENTFTGLVEVSLYVGEATEYYIDVAGEQLRATQARGGRFRRREKVSIELPADECVAVPSGPEPDSHTEAVGSTVPDGVRDR